MFDIKTRTQDWEVWLQTTWYDERVSKPTAQSIDSDPYG